MFTKQAEFPFAEDEVVVARDGFVSVLDGREFVVRLGSRHRSSEEVVHLRPEFFARDATPEAHMPMERPEPEESPPPPQPAPAAVKMLRSRKTVEFEVNEPQKMLAQSASRGALVSTGLPPSKLRVKLHEGRELRADTPWLEALSAKQRRELFEEVV